MSTAAEITPDYEAPDYSVDIVSLSKSFRRRTVGRSSYTTIKSSLLSTFFRSRRKEGSFTHAIKDLTMRIPRGASVGVIGRNGSGKSTLLKLMTGIYKPDQGKVSMNGRVAALIELGAGFHPDFTGRENLYLGGAMYGLSKPEIDGLFEDIVKFAELEAVIDDAVKTYSSGMFMRLGFSLAIHTNPDVLIVDEVLAVGDAAFVSKCKEKIADLRREKKTLILVTHDLDAVERWCDEALWLHEGKVLDRGDPRRVIDHYRQFIERGEEVGLQKQHDKEVQTALETESQASDSQEDRRRWGSREIEITGVRLLNREGQEHFLFHSDDSLRIEIDYKKNAATDDVVFGIGLNRSDGLVVFGTNTDIENIKLITREGGRIIYSIERLSLLEGKYSLDVAVHRADGYPYDYHKGAVTFAARSSFNEIGVFTPAHKWEAA